MSILARCVQIFRDEKGRIQGYRLQDKSGACRDVTSKELKFAIANKTISVINLTLTSDNKLRARKEQATPQKKMATRNKQNNFVFDFTKATISDSYYEDMEDAVILTVDGLDPFTVAVRSGFCKDLANKGKVVKSWKDLDALGIEVLLQIIVIDAETKEYRLVCFSDNEYTDDLFHDINLDVMEWGMFNKFFESDVVDNAIKSAY